MYANGAYRLDLAGVDGAGGVLAVANPEGKRLMITDIILDVATKSTGACTLDAGVAADGATSSDNLLDGLDVGTAAGVFSNGRNPGTNGKMHALWGADQYLTISKATGAATGLVGKAIIKWVQVDE